MRDFPLFPIKVLFSLLLIYSYSSESAFGEKSVDQKEVPPIFEYRVLGSAVQTFTEIADSEFRSKLHEVKIESTSIKQISGAPQNLKKLFKGNPTLGKRKLTSKVEMTLEGTYLEVETEHDLDSFPVELIKSIKIRKRLFGIFKRSLNEKIVLMKIKSEDSKILTEPYLEKLTDEKLRNEEINSEIDKSTKFDVKIEKYECKFGKRDLNCSYKFEAIETFSISN